MAYYHKSLKYHEDTIEKRRITKEDIDFLKELQKEMNTQDNCGIVRSRSWVIRTRRDYVTAEGHEDYYTLFDSENYNYLDLKDIYNILCYLELEVDYYTEEIVIKCLKFENNTITFKYLNEEVSINEDNDNTEGIIIRGMNADELILFFNEHGYAIDITYMAVHWEYDFCFLTQKDAENHLRNNEHHYSSDAHTYCQTGRRSPRYEKLIKLIETVDWDKLGDLE